MLAYEGYAIRPYQLLGIVSFIFAIFLFFVGLLVPEVLPQTKILTNVLVEASSEENEPSPSKPHQNEDKKIGFESKNQPKPHQQLVL